MAETIILGPPGCGKTTKLLSLVEQYLEAGTPPDRIGYFAFTRKAAQEAVERACVRFRLVPDHLPYFRTLHSLAYQQMGITRGQLMTTKHYEEVAAWLKLSGFVPGSQLEDGPFVDFGYGDKFLEIINIARITNRPLREVYTRSLVPLKTDWARVEYVDRGLQHFKKVAGLYDYTDLLEQFVVRDLAPRLDVVFVDEAQDLSAIQWKMVDSLSRRTPQVYIAGDDDQAIYRWAGADISSFIRRSGEVQVLGQSYRIPSSHHIISQRVVNTIPERRHKQFLPRADAGTVTWHRHSEEVDLSMGEWLLLSRTRRGAIRLEQEVRQRGHLYAYGGNRSLDTDVVRAVHNWERLRDGERIRAKDVKHLYKFMNTGTEVAHGHKGMVDVDDGALLSIEDLLQKHGLLHTLPWREALTRIPESDKRYLRACLDKGERLEEKPRITISTIHAAKGGEADNVLLLTDTPVRGLSQWRKSPTDDEDEARVFYVGLTRAKQNLHLIHPMQTVGFPIPH